MHGAGSQKYSVRYGDAAKIRSRAASLSDVPPVSRPAWRRREHDQPHQSAAKPRAPTCPTPAAPLADPPAGDAGGQRHDDERGETEAGELGHRHGDHIATLGRASSGVLGLCHTGGSSSGETTPAESGEPTDDGRHGRYVR